MVISMAVSVKEGLQVIANGKVAIIKKIRDHQRVEVVLSATGEVRVIHLDELEYLNVLDVNNTAPGYLELERRMQASSLEELQVAEERFEVIRRWKSGELSAKGASIMLNVTLNHLYKLARNYNEKVGHASMLQFRRGRKPGVSGLSGEVDKIILDVFKEKYKGKGASFSVVWRGVEVECLERGLPVPTRLTVTKKIKSAHPKSELVRLKEGAEVANQLYKAKPGKHIAESPLSWVQMDHTLVDIILLANDRISTIGRPWLTVLIDKCTRVILGYYLSLHAPSALSVACALTHAVLRKKDYLARHKLEGDDYPFYGLPKVLHMDNAAEFKSAKFQKACSLFGIETKYRPYGGKHFGGHVERYIGTMMNSKVHLLKGTTMSNVVARRGLDSEKEATMTFSDFSAWFAREIVIYHSTVHSELKKSPRKAWFDYFAPHHTVPFPPQISDPLQFRLNFMQEDSRKIHPEGILFKGNVYWDPVLSPYVGSDNVPIKFDPFSMRQIWVHIEGRYCQVNSSDLTRSDFSYSEYQAAKFFKEPVRAGSLDDSTKTKTYRENEDIVNSSRKKTKRARRQEAAAQVYAAEFNLSLDQEIRTSKVKPDYSQPPKKFIPE